MEGERDCLATGFSAALSRGLIEAPTPLLRLRPLEPADGFPRHRAAASLKQVDRPGERAESRRSIRVSAASGRGLIEAW